MNKEFENALPGLISNHLKAKDLVSDIDYRIRLAGELERMGSFAACIGQALLLADKNNLNLLCASFTDLILQASTNLGIKND